MNSYLFNKKIINTKQQLTLYDLICLPEEYFQTYNYKCEYPLTEYETLNDNKRKNLIIYNHLNVQQRNFIDKVHLQLIESLDEWTREEITDNKVILLDAPPGTGKSISILSLAATLKKRIYYLVYTKHLVNLARSYNINSITCCNFLMINFNMNYFEAKQLFYKTFTLNEWLQFLLKLIKTRLVMFEMSFYDFIILDEYTVVSPLYIILLYLIAIKCNVNLIFVGDRNQQNSISKNIFHYKNNYSLVNRIADENIKFDQQIRIVDQEYNQKIQILKQTIENAQDNISMNFYYLYELYKLFPEKFHLEEDTSNVYFSQFHRNIKSRILRACVLNRDKLIQVPFFVHNKIKNTYEKIQLPHSKKFLSFLPLIQNYYYLYTDNNNTKYEVQFLNYIPQNKTVRVRMLHDNSIIFLSIDKIEDKTPRSYTSEERAYITQNKKTVIYQFPIKLLCLTYHAVQGQTINQHKIELDTEANTYNAIYVGLTRIREGNQLQKLHTSTTKLNSLVVTHKMNDEYLYYTHKNTARQKHEFIEVKTLQQFNYYNKDCRIKKQTVLNQILEERKNKQKSLQDDKTGLEVMLEFIKQQQYSLFLEDESEVIKKFENFIK